MIENEKQDLTTSLPPLVDAQPNLLDPSVEVKDEKEKEKKEVKLEPADVADLTKLDVPKAEDRSLVEKPEVDYKLGAFAADERRNKSIAENNIVYDYQEKNKGTYKVSQDITDATSILKGTTSGEIDEYTNEALLLIKGNKQSEVNELLRGLSESDAEKVRLNLKEQGVSTYESDIEAQQGEASDFPGITLGEVEIGEDAEVGERKVIPNSVGEIIQKQITSVNSSSMSSKKAWADKYFGMDMFEDWQKQRSPGSNRTNYYQEDLKAYLGDKYELYKQNYNIRVPIYSTGGGVDNKVKTIVGYEDQENFKSIDLESLIENNVASQEDVDAAISAGRSEMAQISMEVLLGSGDKSVKAQLELLQGVRVFEQEVGKAVYLRTFEDLKERIGEVKIGQAFVDASNNDPETFMELFELAKVGNVLNEKGFAGVYTTPQMYLSKLIANASSDMVKSLNNKVKVNIEALEKEQDDISESFSTINSIQDSLYKKIDALDKKPNKTVDERKKLVDLVGQYNANSNYLDKSSVNSIGSTYNNIVKHLELDIDLLNSKFEKGKIGEYEYNTALGKNYNGWEKASANIETQLFGGFEASIRRFSGGNETTKGLRLEEDSMRQNMADKIMFTKQNWWHSIESSMADNAASTVAGLSLFIPGYGQAIGMTQFFAMSTGGKFKQIEAEKESAKKQLDPNNIFNIDSQIAATTDRQELFRLNQQKKNAQSTLQQSWWMETGVGIMNGITEVATERFMGAGRIAKNFRSWSKVKANASVLRKTYGALKGTAIGLPGELLQETTVQTLGNVYDRTLLGRDVGIFEGVNKQFVIDVGIGTLMLNTGGHVQNSYNTIRNSFSTRTEKKEIAKKIKEVENIDAQIKKTSPINFDKRIELQNKREDLVLDIVKADKKSVQKLEKLTVAELEQISELDRKRNNALKEINEQANSGVYGVNMTSGDKAILDDAKKQYNDLTDQIEDIAGKEYAELAELLEMEVKAYEAKTVDEKKKTERPRDKRVENKAQLIYEMGMASFSNSVARQIARDKGMNYFSVSVRNMSKDQKEKFYADVKNRHGFTDEQIEEFKRAAEKSDVAKYVSGGKGTAYVFEDNVNSSIILGTEIQGQIAAVSPIHEVFHHQNTQSGILNKDGDVIQSAKEAITGLQSLMKSKFDSGEITEEVYNEFKSRVEIYRKTEGKEKQAEEQFGLLDDGINHEEMVNLINDFQSIGAIKRNDWNALFGFKNYLNTLLGKTRFGKNIPNLINFNKTEDVYNYISNFNTKALEGKVMRGSIVDEEERQAEQKSSRIAKDGFANDTIAEELGLKNETKSIVEVNDKIFTDIVSRSEKNNTTLKESVTQRDKDKLVTNNMPRVMALANQAVRAAKNLTLDESLKIKDIDEWTSEYSLKLVELANSWDPGKNDSFGAYMNQLLPLKYSGILDKLKAKVETTSADREEAGTTAYNNVIDEGPTQDEILDGEVKPKKAKGATLVNDMIGLSDNIRPNAALEAIKDSKTDAERQSAEDNYQQELLNTPLYKLVAKLNPDLTPDKLRLKPLMKELQKGDLRPVFDMIVKEFGLDPKKVAIGATMPQGDIRAAQRFISSNLDLIVGSLPEGFDSNFKATGVQNVLLKAFYNQREVRSSTKAGNKVWVKKPVNSILKDKTAAMAVFGLTEAGIPNVADKAANVAPPIQAIARWTASNIVNQTIRELEANDVSPKAEAKRNALNDGKSKMLSSKMAISLDRTDPALGIEFRSMLPDFGVGLEKINTLDKASVRSVVEEVYKDLLTKPQITQFVADLTKPGTGILARYDLLNKNYKEVKAKLFDIKEFVEMEVVMTEQAAENQIAKILGVDVDRASLLADATTVNRLRKTAITGFAVELENSGLSDVDIVKVVLAIKEMHASAGNIGKAELSTNGNPGGEVSNRIGGRKRRQSGQITEGNADFFALIKNGSQKVYDLMLLSDKGSVNRKKLSDKYGVSFENYSEESAVVLKEIQNNTFSLDGRKSQAKLNQDVTLRVLEFVKNKIDEGVLSKADALVVVGAFGSNMKSPSRKSAYAAYVATNANTFKNPGQDLEYDHMKPHNVVMNQLANAVFNTKDAKKKQDKIDEAFSDYVVGIIPKKFDDLVKAMGMQYNMQPGYDPKATGLRGVLGRLYNDRTLGGKDVVTIENIETGEIIGEPFVRASEIIVNDVKQTEQLKKVDEAKIVARVSSSKMPAVGMSTFDFDETLVIGGKNSVTATLGDKSVKISSEDFPLKGPALAEQGYEFDFSDFVNVKGGKEGPLMQKLKNQVAKYGVDNVFVLTARMQEAAPAIHEWLKSKGVNLKFENITGLGNSTGEAKALWMLEKFGEGYNDMYFVDDAMPNVTAVKNVLDQLDIKSNVQQAKMKSSKMSVDFNRMLERTKGIDFNKSFSSVVAGKRGKNVGPGLQIFGGKTFFVPPSAEDFAGLLRYFVGKGKQGDADIKYLEDALIKPFNRAYLEMNEMRGKISEDYKTLLKQFPEIKSKLGKLMPNSEFTLDNAIRVYLWNKAGFEIPGLSKRDTENLVGRVEVDQVTKAFADTLGVISKQKDGYIKPEVDWETETIALDLQNVVSKIGRKKFLEEWIQNKEEFFTPDNMNKIEAAYGTNFKEALKDILYRMETGVNRSTGKSYGEGWTNWVNGSVGAIMFFNSRSAVLQTLSMVNFVNFEDNNIIAAGKAFANQKQYWSDFSMLFNSSYLKGRRAGLATNVNEAELANAVAGATNKAKAALGYLLKIGFTPTQVADSFAIASGGATFYRNRVSTNMKNGMNKADAEKAAMLDFMELAEETQQSARPDRISQQQASPLGRLILAFANTPLQYNRLIKKAAGDLVNGRGDWRSNVSRILYYGAAQNFIFSAMQQALFAVAFDDEDDDKILDTKTERIANGMLDSLLRGSGIAGAVVSTLKNSIIEYMEQDAKGFKADYAEVLVEAINLSPPLGSKVRKLYSAGKARKFNKDIMKSMDTFDYNNPTWEALGNVTSAITNLPLDRLIRKIDNVREALNQDNTALQRTFLMLGWDAWSLKVGKKKVINKGKESEYVKYLPLKQQAQEKAEEKLDKNKKKKKGRFGKSTRFN